MAVLVVDLLKEVQVQHHHAKRNPQRLIIAQLVFQKRVDVSPIRQLRELIKQREPFEFTSAQVEELRGIRIGKHLGSTNDFAIENERTNTDVHADAMPAFMVQIHLCAARGSVLQRRMQRATGDAQLVSLLVDMVEQVIVAKMSQHLLRREAGNPGRTLIPKGDSPVPIDKVNTFI